MEVRPGIRWNLADAEAGDVSRIGPARWMLDRLEGRAPVAWRLTGSLFRPHRRSCPRADRATERAHYARACGGV